MDNEITTVFVGVSEYDADLGWAGPLLARLGIADPDAVYVLEQLNKYYIEEFGNELTPEKVVSGMGMSGFFGLAYSTTGDYEEYVFEAAMHLREKVVSMAISDDDGNETFSEIRFSSYEELGDYIGRKSFDDYYMWADDIIEEE